MTIGLMLNHNAGVGRTTQISEYVFSKLQAAGIEYELLTADSAAAAIELANTRASEFDAILGVGGDGTIHTAAQVAFQNSLPLGVIAAGSGDDIARACGLPHGRNLAAMQRSVDHFVQAWLARELVEVDSIRVKTADGKLHIVLAVMSAGFDSRVNSNSAKMTKVKGTLRYVLAMLKTLGNFKPIDYHWILNGTEMKFQAMVVAIGNGSMFGGGMKVCPSANIRDGQFDVLVVNKIPIATLLAVFPKIFSGKHVLHPKVNELRGTSLWLDAPTEQVWGDGEYLGLTPMQIDLLPNSIKIFGVRA